MNLSELKPSLSVLSGGLDLSTPKNVATPGTLIDCMNVEVAETIGYKSIDGIVRHDGRVDAASLQEGELSVIYVEAGIDGMDILVGSPLYVGDSPFGIVKAISTPQAPRTGNYITVYVTGRQSINVLGDSPITFTGRTSDGAPTAPFTGYVGGPDLIFAGDDYIPPAKESIDFQNSVYSAVSNETEGLPGGRRAHGLHWFKDRLYAVANKREYKYSPVVGEVLPGMWVRMITGRPDNVYKVSDVSKSSLWIVDKGTEYLPVFGDLEVVEWDEDSGSWTNPSGIRIEITDTLPMDRSTKASLWRTTEEEFVRLRGQEPDSGDDNVPYGWNPVDIGWEIGFEEGSYPAENLPTINRRSLDSGTDNEPLLVETDIGGSDGSGATLTDPGSYGEIPPFSDVQVGGGTLEGDAGDIEEEGDGNYLEFEYRALSAGGGTLPLGSHRRAMYSPLALTNFSAGLASQIPEDVVVRGIEVRVKAFIEVSEDETIENTSLIAMQLRGSGELGGESKVEAIPDTALSEDSMATITFGGLGDLWGVDEILRGDVLHNGFGIDFQFLTDFRRPDNSPSHGIERTIKIDSIKVIVHYVNPTPKVYFWDGTSDVSALIGASHVVDGEFPKGTAKGVLHLYSIESVSGSGKDYVTVGDGMYLLPNGQGKKVLEVVDFVREASLPPLDALVEANSRFQFRTYNYYANEDWDALYGVSGAGRAFAYDGIYFRYIYTGLDDELDKPRHVETHLDHLCLGYASGSVFISVAGDPEDFSGLRGAFEVATGDRVTGLLSLPGTMLGIGCQGSMWGLAGDGVQSFSLQALRPKEGCIEYTFEDCGMPVYCSNTGVTVFSTTPSYGDFSPEKLSYKVYPFLFNRTRNSQSSTHLGINKGILCAIPVRKKGQYILFFRDGYALCCTLSGGQPPPFTYRRYAVNTNVSIPDPSPHGELYYRQNPYTLFTPIAHTVQVDSLGRERVFFSHYNTGGGPSNTSNDNLFPVFEMDRGWSMAGEWFPWWFRTNFDFVPEASKTPADRKVSRGVKLYGMSHGFSTLSASVENSFRPPDPNKNYYDISLPRIAGLGDRVVEFQDHLTDFYSNMAIVAKEGEFFTFTVRNVSPKYNNNERTTSPPVVSQVILKEYDSAREGA